MSNEVYDNINFRFADVFWKLVGRMKKEMSQNYEHKNGMIWNVTLK
jgi:hypothetical protein